MNGNEMRVLMEKIGRSQINEGYDDRVAKVVSWFSKEYPEGITKSQFMQTIEKRSETLADMLNVVELRPKKSAAVGSRGKTGDSRKEFIKDVAAKMDFRRNTSSADAKRERTNQVLYKLSTVIQDAVGNAFPDGDPFDQIFPEARKLGVPANSVLEWLDRATKKHLGAKDYHTYLSEIWDDYISQTSDTLGSRDNPWR